MDHRWSRDAIVAVLSLGLMSMVAAQDARLTMPLDTRWHFQQASGLLGVEARALDDKRWTSVDVPHTWNRLGITSVWLSTCLDIWEDPGSFQCALWFAQR